MSVQGPPDLLATIVAATERGVQVRSRTAPIATLDVAWRRPRGDAFERVLRDSAAPRVIAECKRRSPSRGILRQDYDVAAHARAYAAAGAAAISVLTEPTFFDGAREHLRAVRDAVDLPVLRKDFVVSEYQVAEAAALGADAVLLIVSALTATRLRALLDEARRFGLACLVEAHDAGEVARAVDAGASIVGVNSRNLHTLAVDPQVFDQAAAVMPRGVVAVAESGIRTRSDLDRLTALGYSAFLVGERLMSQQDPGAALDALRQAQA